MVQSYSTLQYKRLKINARDKLNFCALKLANFPKAVGLNHLVSKGEFLYLANRPKNWDKIIDFSKPSDYLIESRTKEEKEKFLKWYKVERKVCGGKFNFRDQIVKYCSMDVTVLRLCALKFRSDFKLQVC